MNACARRREWRVGQPFRRVRQRAESPWNFEKASACRTIAQGRGTGKNKQAIDESDIRQAVRKLSVLGGGFQVVDIGGEAYVRSVPGELDQDANAGGWEGRWHSPTLL